MRAAIYARFSSDRQTDLSLDAQITSCRREIERRGWQEAAVFSDAETPGTVTLRRHGYQDMLARARRREFDVILVDELSRLTRRVSEQAGLMERLPLWGVHLRAIQDGIDTLASPEAADALVMVHGFTAAAETKSLSHRTRSRMREHVKALHHVGGAAYGYRSRPIHEHRPGDPEGTGRIVGYEHVIHELEAGVVRRIFELYVNGASPRQIAGQLNAEAVPAPAERWRNREGVRRTWCATAIAGDRKHGTGILNNEKYSGRVIWNRRTWLRHPERDGRRVWRDMPEREWLILEAPDLRIVPDDLWQRVKARQRRTGRDDLCTASGQRNRRLLSGILKCGQCGANMVLSGKDTYVCAARQQRGDSVCDSRLTVSARRAEAAVLHELENLAAAPAMVKRLEANVAARAPRRRPRSGQEGDQLRLRFAETEREISALVDAVAKGIPLGDELVSRMRQAEDRQEELRRAILRANDQRSAPGRAAFSRLIRKVVSDLRAQLAKGRVREVKGAMTCLVQRIEARPRPVQGEARPAATLVLKGALEGILELAAIKNAGSGGAIRSFLMVPGQGHWEAEVELPLPVRGKRVAEGVA